MVGDVDVGEGAGTVGVGGLEDENGGDLVVRGWTPFAVDCGLSGGGLGVGFVKIWAGISRFALGVGFLRCDPSPIAPRVERAKEQGLGGVVDDMSEVLDMMVQ